jgi:hypothetical protein
MVIEKFLATDAGNFEELGRLNYAGGENNSSS